MPNGPFHDVVNALEVVPIIVTAIEHLAAPRTLQVVHTLALPPVPHHGLFVLVASVAVTTREPQAFGQVVNA